MEPESGKTNLPSEVYRGISPPSFGNDRVIRKVIEPIDPASMFSILGLFVGSVVTKFVKERFLARFSEMALDAHPNRSDCRFYRAVQRPIQGGMPERRLIVIIGGCPQAVRLTRDATIAAAFDLRAVWRGRPRPNSPEAALLSVSPPLIFSRARGHQQPKTRIKECTRNREQVTTGQRRFTAVTSNRRLGERISCAVQRGAL